MLFFKYSYATMQKHHTTQIFPCSVTYWTVYYLNASIILTPRSTVFLARLTVPRLITKYPTFYRNCKFIAVFTYPYPEPD